jgi:hypothetical protein
MKEINEIIDELNEFCKDIKVINFECSFDEYAIYTKELSKVFKYHNYTARQIINPKYSSGSYEDDELDVYCRMMPIMYKDSKTEILISSIGHNINKVVVFMGYETFNDFELSKFIDSLPTNIRMIIVRHKYLLE